MFSDEREKVSVISNADGTLSTQGSDDVFHLDTIRSLWLSTTSFSINRSWDRYDDDEPASPSASLLAEKARIDKDTLGIIGTTRETREIPLTLSALPVASKAVWTGNLGFFGHDWEIGNDEEFWCQVYIPENVFDELKARVRSGPPFSVTLILDTELWVKSPDQHAPPSVGVNRYLAPDKRGEVHNISAKVRATSLRWNDALPEVSSDSRDEPMNSPTHAQSRAVTHPSDPRNQTALESLEAKVRQQGALLYLLLAVVAVLVWGVFR